MSSASALDRPRAGWNHNVQFHGWILRLMPPACESALDVGCGDGVLTEKLAVRAKRATGIDVSAQMIAVARQRHASGNLTYIAGDILSHPLPAGGFDFIAAVAVLHHMPLDVALRRLATLVRPGGVLAVVGLARNESLVDYAFSAASIPVNRVARLSRGWWESGAPTLNPAQTFAEIRRVARRELPAVGMRRRLFFRYTMQWQNRAEFGGPVQGRSI